MPRKRVIDNSLLQRVRKADQAISKWMRETGAAESEPEECMEILVNEGIYEYDRNGKAHYFREDLRALRDNSMLDIFENLVIHQVTPGAKWYIRLKSN